VNEASAVGSIAHVIQLAVAPVFLLTGVGSMLGVLTNRLGRLVDRARRLESDLSGQEPWRHQLLNQWLKDLARRTRLIHWAISLCIGCAILIGSVVVLLFVSSITNVNFDSMVAALFMLAMLSLIGGLLCFMREIFLATRQLRIGQPERPAPMTPPENNIEVP
jgi:hypothetical protein